MHIGPVKCTLKDSFGRCSIKASNCPQLPTNATKTIENDKARVDH